MIYLSSGGTETVDLSRMNGSTLCVWWLDPKNGECTEKKEIQNTGTWEVFTSPNEGKRNDWVLVIDDKECGYGRPGRLLSEVREEFDDTRTEIKKVFPGWE